MAAKKRTNAPKAGLSEPSPHYHGHRERLRARFREAGAEAVSDYDFLELVLFCTIPQRDVCGKSRPATTSRVQLGRAAADRGRFRTDGHQARASSQASVRTNAATTATG